MVDLLVLSHLNSFIMCLSPLHIISKSVYNLSGYSPRYYDIPCGHCIECQENYKSEWQTRLSFHIHSLYKRGGQAVMLTFTYNDEHLPMYHDNINNFHFPCFNHNDVLSFLNLLKVNCWRRFGKSSYTYFITCEYGNDTQRPHYHAIFFLEPIITNITDFCELCRNLWSHGFMFPKYSASKHTYVDSYNQATSPLIRSLNAGAKYLTKYVTKDFSYINNPLVSDYISVPANKARMKPFLPKHWQSNRLGYTIIDHVNLFDKVALHNLFHTGIYNPLLGKNVPLPSYFLNKLIYKNVNSSKTEIPRPKDCTSDPLNKKFHYDRELSSFGKEYLSFAFLSRVKRTENKISTILQLIKIDNVELYHQIYSSLSNLINYDKNYIHSLALFHEFYKNLSDDILEDCLKSTCGSFKDIFSDDFCSQIYVRSKDTKFLRHLRKTCLIGEPTFKRSLFNSIFKDYIVVDAAYSKHSQFISKIRCEENLKRYTQLLELKRKYKCRFDKTLC